MRTRVVAAAFAAVALPAGAAIAIPPAPGDRLPPIAGHDLEGKPRSLQEMLGDERALLVVITSRDQAETLDAWYQAADARLPPGAQGAGIVSLDLPFFVPESYARGRARRRVPDRFEHRVLLDGDQELARRLGLEDGSAPRAFAVGPDGRVLAAAEGPPTGPDAARVWEALGAR